MTPTRHSRGWRRIWSGFSGEKFPDLYREVCGGFGQGIADKLFFTNAADFFARWEGGM